MTRHGSRWSLWTALCVAATFSTGVVAEDILKTVSFRACGNNTDITVNRADISFNADTKVISFDVSGSSAREQNVTAVLQVSAYGNDIFSNEFNPCDKGTFVEQLCPVPAGAFSAKGDQEIPTQFADMVPEIAFKIPDIAAWAKLELKTMDNEEEIACIQSQVSNGKTANVPAVPYVAAGVAGAALVATGASAVGAVFAGGAGGVASGGGGGTGTVSPSFTEVVGWFQGLAMNGMLSVNYPPIYRSFTKNFAFSTGLIPWEQLQVGIDNFRAKTGGNLDEDSIEALRNATLIFPDGSTATPEKGFAKAKRATEMFARLAARQIQINVGAAAGDAQAQEEDGGQGLELSVSGIQAFTQQLMVPKSNTFMTVLLVVAILIGAIAIGILLVKVVLEAWALFGNFPQSLAGFRKHYWGSIARTITTLILLLYGIWVLYCVFQFTQGDSWAAKTLAGVTLFIFTAILLVFSFRIWWVARQLKNEEGATDGLYEKKEIWVKYSLFYESYRKNYWWIFVPTIIYMFVKGFTLAAGDGHGMAQTIAMLIVEGLMLIMLLWSRPFERRSGNIINIAIQVVRFLSVACILVFVEEFGIRQTTQTVTGVVMIAVQSTLTGILVILIAWNAFNACCKKNRHRERRKELEKQRDMDALTPLDARNSLLLERDQKIPQNTMFTVTSTGHEKDPAMIRSDSPEGYTSTADKESVLPGHNRVGSNGSYGAAGHNRSGSNDSYGSNGHLRAGSGGQTYRPLTPSGPYDSERSLMGNAAPPGMSRQPTIPLNNGYGAFPRSNPSPAPYGSAYRYPPGSNNGGYSY
ncbi:transient receptor potential (TRP) ion channel domain-containing protein [Sarocladium implicatum]|nr:transient receptor potential (TRP) ion channel domain-containing protein [Sarocladium implicatum]